MVEVPHLRGVEADCPLFCSVHFHADLIAVYPFDGSKSRFETASSRLLAVNWMRCPGRNRGQSRGMLRCLAVALGHRCLLAVLLLDGDQVLFVVGGDHGSVAGLFNAMFLAAPRVVEDIVGLVSRRPASINAGHIGSGVSTFML